MPEPAAIFSAANAAAFFAWIALAAALFLPAARRPVWLATGLILPAAFAVVYVALVARGLAAGGGEGGFGSIPQVRAIFASDGGLTAGWLHYLAFDLFVGTWIARVGLAARVPRLLILPCLALTFVAGPAGLLLFLLVRLALRRRLAEALA